MLLLLACLLTVGLDPPTAGDTTSQFARIVSSDPAKHAQVLRELDTQVDPNLAEELRSYLSLRFENRKQHAENHGERSSITTALRALGRLRDEKSVPILMKYLDWFDSELPVSGVAPAEMLYPALKSLNAIGKPAVEAAIGHLKREDAKEPVRFNRLQILIHYYGPAIAKTRLRREMEREVYDKAAQLRLAMALHSWRTDERDLSVKD